MSSVAPPSSLIANRWRLGALLGKGAQGSVYSAWDERRGRRVAAKLVPLIHDDVRDLKREFRLLSSVRHPNVVRALDLYVGEGIALAATEYIEGVSLDRHLGGLRDDPSFLTALRSCFAGVMRALVELHARGIAHRDVKPANVLVRPDGQVVLVDLGLARLNTASGSSPLSGTSGTISYMPPEQFWALSGEPKVDLYAAGAVFAEMLLGRLPWEPGPTRFSSDSAAPDFTALLTADHDLGRLISSLLNPVPEERPSAAEALSLLSTVHSTSIPPAAVFIGRTRELEAVLESQRHAIPRARALVIVGDAGVGKTKLMEEVLVRIGTALVVRHRCHPRETLAFQALDGVVEEVVRNVVLSGRLTSRHADEWASLARIFPELAGPLGIADPPTVERGRAAPDVLEDAGRALASALASLGDDLPVVIWIDDWHWGDRDSARIIAAALDGARPNTWWVFTTRPSPHAEELSRIALRIPHDRISVGPLQRATCEEWLALVRPDLDAARRGSLLDVSGGWPIYLHELGRLTATEAPGTATELLQHRLRSGTPLAREILALIGVAATPLAPEVLSGVLDTTIQDGVDELVDARVLTWVSSDEGPFRLAPYHDLVRETIVNSMSPAETKRSHERLLGALAGHAPNGVLLHHALGATRHEDARRYARAAIADALRTFAYDRVLGLLDTIAALDPHADQGADFLRDKAIALSGLGRGVDSGRTFILAASVESDAETRARLQRMAVEQLMGAGDYEGGLEVLRSLLERNHIPAPRRGLAGLLTILWLQSRTRRVQARRGSRWPLDDALRERLELLWVAGAGIGLYDSIAAFQLQFRHAHHAARTNSDAHSALSLSTQSLNAFWEGRDAGRRRGEKLLAQAEWHARRAADPRAIAHVMLMRIVSLFLVRRFVEAFASSEDGERWCLAQCPEDGWHIASFRWFQAHLLASLGQMDRLRSVHETRTQVAEERNDRFLLLNFRVGRPILAWLAADLPEKASSMLDWSEKEATGSPYFIYQATLARAWQLLYQRRGREAFEMVKRRKAVLRKQFMLRFESVRIELDEIEALCALTGAVASGGDRKLLKAAAALCARLEREDVTWAAPHAERLRAALAERAGMRHRRDELLERSAVAFETGGQRLDAALARYAISGDERTLHGMGIVRPDSFARIWHPWTGT